MREIKFRGKRIDNGEWVYGYYVAFSIPQDYPRFKVEHRIYTHLDEADCSVSFEVIPETVGQFTGLKDKNGKKIYESDICVGMWDGSLDYTKQKFVVKFENGAFVDSYFGQNIGEYTNRRLGNTIEVIGNIHEEKSND